MSVGLHAGMKNVVLGFAVILLILLFPSYAATSTQSSAQTTGSGQLPLHTRVIDKYYAGEI